MWWSPFLILWCFCRYNAAPSEPADWPAVPEPCRWRVGFCPSAGWRRTTLGFLGCTHQQHGRRAQDDCDLWHCLCQHRWGFWPQGWLVALSYPRGLLLLLHSGKISSQRPVCDADEEQKRGAGHRVRGKRWRGEEGMFQTSNSPLISNFVSNPMSLPEGAKFSEWHWQYSIFWSMNPMKRPKPAMNTSTKPDISSSSVP